MIDFRKIFKKSRGFTIVELAVVIVVIGILATITTISYIGWKKNIQETQVKSDLTNAKTAMESYRNFNGKYPSDILVTTFKASPGVTLSGGSSDNGSTFTIYGTVDATNKRYMVTNNTDPLVSP